MMPRTSPQSIVDDALLAICTGTVPQLPDVPGLTDDLVAAVRHHRIAPLAHVALRGPRPDLASLLQPDRNEAILNHLRVSALLVSMAHLLDGIEWLAFKGPILSEFAHPVAGLRFYNDLDLLIAPADLREACGRLLNTGWQVVVGDTSLLSKELPGEIPLADAHRIILDLHWSMVVMKSVRNRFQISTGPLLERREPAEIGPAKLWRLSGADELVHVCHHAALIGATRLGHVLDADQLARQVDDWDEVVTRAHEWGAEVQVAAVLGRAHRLLGTPVPTDLNRLLGLGRGLGWTMEHIDRAWPVHTLRRDASWSRLATRSLRPGLLRSGAVAVRRATRGVLERTHPIGVEQPRIPASEQGIATYLTRVEASLATTVRSA